MDRPALTVTAKMFCDYLAGRLPPAGRPAVQRLEARALAVIDSAAGGAPDVREGTADLTEEGVRRGLDWLFGALIAAHDDGDWAGLALREAHVLAAAAGPAVMDRVRALSARPGSHDPPAEG